MKNLLFLVLMLLTSYCFGQLEIAEEDENIYKKEFSVDLKIHTSGYGVGIVYGLIRKKSTLIGHLSGASIKHPQEVKRRFENPATLGNPPRAFVYGKQNSFYSIKLGIGQKFNLSAISKERGITIGAAYHIGPSFGLIKPYYLEIERVNDMTTLPEVFIERLTEENKAEFLAPFSIRGYAGFGYGLNEITATVGGYAQGSLRFEWGSQRNFIRAIETGLMIEAFPRTIPIMVEDEVTNDFLFVNLFIAIQIGKRS